MENEQSEEREAPELRGTNEPPAVSGDRLTGYAVLYGVESDTITDRRVSPRPFREVFAPGAFDDSIKTVNVTFVHKHDDDAEYGDTASGSLTLQSDMRGVAYDLKLPPYAHSLRQKAERKEYPGVSIKFVARDVEWKDGVRYIKKGILQHVSPVYKAFYPTDPPALVKSDGNNLSLYKAKALRATV